MYNRAVGTTMPNLNTSSCAASRFRSSASARTANRRFLSGYDDLIENNTRRIAILEEMAQAIYREWFVNFRFPGHEQVEMVESELGPIPEGWKVSTVGEVADVNARSINRAARQTDQLHQHFRRFAGSN